VPLGAAAISCGALVALANVTLALRSVTYEGAAKHVSGIPVVGGVALCLGLRSFDSTRWCAWVPIALDPCGLAAFAIGQFLARRPQR
jgi:hypothetical protein